MFLKVALLILAVALVSGASHSQAAQYDTNDAAASLDVDSVQGGPNSVAVANLTAFACVSGTVPATPAESIEFEVLHLSSSGDVVHTERVDRFLIAGRKAELPVAGVFEVRAGKIAAWRDYFDLQVFLKQTGMG